MRLSRRELPIVPFLAALVAKADGKILPSKTYSFDDLPIKTANGNRTRAILNGETHSGFPIEMHLTELAPGQAPHPPHHHVHEEMILIQAGAVDVTISGKTVTLGPGSSAYVASNEEHGWRNAGTVNALYFVIALGPQ